MLLAEPTDSSNLTGVLALISTYHLKDSYLRTRYQNVRNDDTNTLYHAHPCHLTVPAPLADRPILMAGDRLGSAIHQNCFSPSTAQAPAVDNVVEWLA